MDVRTLAQVSTANVAGVLGNCRDDAYVLDYVLTLLGYPDSLRKVAETNMVYARNKNEVYPHRNIRLRAFRMEDQVIRLRPLEKNKLDVQ